MSKNKPNIIFIITDQQRYDTINALLSHMETPTLDKMINEGIHFSNCFINGASCVPARASLFTGYYPHTTGVLRNGSPWGRTWVEKLAETGYRCINVGKMHTIPYDAPAGFHERYVVENKDRFLEGRYYFDEWDKALASMVSKNNNDQNIANVKTTTNGSERLSGNYQNISTQTSSLAIWQNGGSIAIQQPNLYFYK